MDADRRNECSTGIHIGSYKYAKDFGGGGRLLLVRFNPKDAVAVPKDCGFQKLRACAYTVIQDVTGSEEFTKPVYDVGENSLRLDKAAIVARLTNIANAQGLDLSSDFDVSEIREGYLADSIFEEQDFQDAVAEIRSKIVKPSKVQKVSGEAETRIVTYVTNFKKRNSVLPNVKQIQSSLKGSEWGWMTYEDIRNILAGTKFKSLAK